jgi:hypothetical protein
MIHNKLKLSIALALILAVPAFAAPERRRAASPAGDVPPTLATINGTVTDVDNGNPIVNADIVANTGHTITDSQGKYSFNVLSAPKQILVTVTRSGYETGTATVNIVVGATPVIDFKLKAKSTVTLKETSGVIHTLDADSVQFAYLIPFSGYARTDNANFCTPAGKPATPAREDFIRITGPAKPSNNSSCCTLGPVMGLTIETKSGGTQQVFFADSCYGNEVDFIGRDHVTGQYTYYNFEKIAEVVFP